MIGLAEYELGQPLTPAAKRFAKENRLQVQVGISAERSILAVTGDENLPASIDDVPLVTTSEFEGFAVVIK